MRLMRKALVTVVALALAELVTAPTSAETPSSSAVISINQDISEHDTKEPLWIARGSDFPDGTPAGHWVMPDGFSFWGKPDLSRQQVLDAAYRFQRLEDENASPDLPKRKNEVSNVLTKSDAKNALVGAGVAIIVTLFLLSYLYRLINGVGAVGRHRKYAALASLSIAPLCMTTLNALLRGIGPAYQDSESLPVAIFRTFAQLDSFTVSNIIGLGMWAVIITGAAFSFGWFVENRAR